MQATRAIVVLLLILAVVVAYNPGVRAEVADTWETIRPAVVEFMDSFYAAVRNLIVGNDSDSGNQNNETPAPGPGVNFERIVTLSDSFSD
jgi:hypothetical protein